MGKAAVSGSISSVQAVVPGSLYVQVAVSNIAYDFLTIR